MTALAPQAAQPADPADAEAGRHLFGRTGDFLALGGASLIVLPIFYLLPHDLNDSIKTATLWLAVLINFPHFAVSYGLFYRDFGAKVTPGRSSDPTLHLRYRFAGVVVPALLAAYLLGALAFASSSLLAHGYNMMVLTVGWHYVKQGYGMAMVDGALKKAFFNTTEKRLLRGNGYIAWAVAWMAGNRRLSDDADYFGVPISSFPIPDLVFWPGVVALAVSSAAMVAMLYRRFSTGQATPWTGVTAYLISVYPWLVFVGFNRNAALVVPALHSFQYLWVVARFSRNRAAAEPAAPSWKRSYLGSIIGGALAFWILPLLFDMVVPYDADLGLAFLFIFWVGINVHHYCLDNVMWRRGNPDVTQHLFAPAS